MNDTAKILLEKQTLLDAKLNSLDVIVQKARKGAFGLTLEEDKTPEWREAKRQWGIYWKMYQDTNKALVKLRKCVGHECINGKRVPIYQYK